MNKISQVSLTCAFGALIGTVLGLDITNRFQYGSYFWSIGTIIGGMISYLLIDPQKYWISAVYTCRSVVGWRPYKLYWKAFFANWANISSITLNIVILNFLLNLLVIDSNIISPNYILNKLTELLLTWFFMCILFGLPLTFACGWSFFNYWDENDINLIRIYQKEIGYLTKYNIFVLLFVILKGVISVVTRPLKFCTKIIRFLWDVSVMAITYIHSSLRTVCFFSATLGGIVGYHFGSATAGAIFGGILGAVSYKVVVVSLFKLLPQKSE